MSGLGRRGRPEEAQAPLPLLPSDSCNFKNTKCQNNAHHGAIVFLCRTLQRLQVSATLVSYCFGTKRMCFCPIKNKCLNSADPLPSGLISFPQLPLPHTDHH